jgi:hypothetical protein
MRKYYECQHYGLTEDWGITVVHPHRRFGRTCCLHMHNDGGDDTFLRNVRTYSVYHNPQETYLHRTDLFNTHSIFSQINTAGNNLGDITLHYIKCVSVQ